MKHQTKIAVRFADIDVMGHVNNAVYLSYFEQARIDFFNSIIGEWNWKTSGVILVRNEVDYKSPVTLEDDVSIQSEVEEIGNKSMTMRFTVYEGDVLERAKVYAQGRCVLVAFDYSQGQTISIPEAWREAFTS